MQHKHIIFAIFLASCSPTTDIVATASDYIGLNEYQNRQQIKEFVGVDPVRTEWCAAFVNAILELEEIPGSNSVSDSPLMARSFLKWGVPINPQDIQRGDLVVFPRGNSDWKGHVGFYVGRSNDGRYIILGGNQYNTVRYDYYDPKKALGIRRWSE